MIHNIYLPEPSYSHPPVTFSDFHSVGVSGHSYIFSEDMTNSFQVLTFGYLNFDTGGPKKGIGGPKIFAPLTLRVYQRYTGERQKIRKKGMKHEAILINAQVFRGG